MATNGFIFRHRHPRHDNNTTGFILLLSLGQSVSQSFRASQTPTIPTESKANDRSFAVNFLFN
jgi:hypothetical protein